MEWERRIRNMAITYNPTKLYRQVQNEAMDQKQLLILLFEGAVRLLQEGRRHLASRDYESWAEQSNRVRRILSELIIALDNSVDTELCEALRSLYIYIQRLVTEGGIEEDMDKIQEAIDLLTQLGSSWKEAKAICQKQDGTNASSNAA